MNTTTTPATFLVADIYGWTYDAPTYSAACRAGLRHAVATGIPTFVEGAYELTTEGMLCAPTTIPGVLEGAFAPAVSS